MKALLWLAVLVAPGAASTAHASPTPPGLIPSHHDPTHWRLNLGMALRATTYDPRTTEVRTELDTYALGTGKPILAGIHIEALYGVWPWLELGGSWTILGGNYAAETYESWLGATMNHFGLVARASIEGLSWSRIETPRRLAILPRLEIGSAAEMLTLHRELLSRWRPYTRGGVDVEIGGPKRGVRAHAGFTYVRDESGPWLAPAAGGLDLELGAWFRW